MADGGTSDEGKGDALGAAPQPDADAAAQVMEGLTGPLTPVPGLLPDGAVDFAGMLAVADILPVMIAYFDDQLVMRFVNKVLANWLERPRSELLGKPLREIIGEEAYSLREPLLTAALKGERQFFASDFDHRSRGNLAIQTDYVPWADSNGRVRGIVIMVQDVTEQRVAERALRESEERFRRIANQAPALMWVTRLDRTRDFVNDAYVDFVGVPREEAAKVDWRTRIHPEDVDRIVAESVAGEASRETFTLEGRYLRADGEYRWLKSVSSPRYGPDGDLVGFIGVGTDITLAKEAELQLRRQVEERTAELARREAQFRAVFEAALEVMVLLDPDGTVLAVNNRREVWRHHDPQQAIGVKLWDTPTLQAFPQHVALMRDGIAKAAAGDIFTAEVAMERDGLATSYLDVSVQPVRGDSGDIIYLLFEARDVTELKAAQEQLRQSQKMEALGQLTGGIAHDFNNLLTVVVGGLDIIAKRIDDERLKTYARNALTAAERGARLTGQLLAFSRVQRLEVRPTPVAPLIENMRPLLRNVLGPGIEKRFDLDLENWPVLADPTQLEVAVLNLAINARDAMPSGGVLSFRTRQVAVTDDAELDDGDYIELSISDTGVGMTEDVVSRAFEPFFTTKEVGKGTGLGLSMVYGMARQSGGTARIESEPGVGTKVSLYFLVSREADQVAVANEDAAEVSHQEAARASVLVVDDDSDVRSFIAASLEEEGYRVRQASDGRQALDALAAEPAELVILDYIMPGLSGAEVASHIRESVPDQPILFVSGYSETEAIKRIAPDAALLQKPFRAVALQDAVRKALAAR